MTNHTPRVGQLVAGVVAMAFCVPAAAEAAGSAKAAAQPADAPTVLNEIIVTASKRAQRLQDAPMAISAVSPQAIQQLSVTQFTDLQKLVPNLAVAGASAPGQGIVVIRGLYAGSGQLTNTSATYIGDTPFTPTGALSLGTSLNVDPDLLDVERVEVLKGPQGTLYGASSLGGLVRIIPTAPKPDAFHALVRVDGTATDGGGSGGGIHASVNLPVTDSAALLVGGFARYDPGFTTNIGTGNKDLGNTRAEGGSAAFKANISPDWDVLVSGFYQSSTTHGYLQQNNIPGTGITPFGERTYNYPNDGLTKSSYWMVEGTTNYKTPVGTFTGTVSHGDYDVISQTDATHTFGAIEAALPPGILPQNFDVLEEGHPTLSKTTVETRFTSTRLGPVEFLGGFFFTNEDATAPVIIQNFSSPGVPLQLPAPLSALNYVAFVNTFDHYREYAGFGDITYYILDNLDVTGGVRYSKETQEGQNVSPAGVGLINFGNATYPSSSDSVIWQATARWRPTPDTSLYFRAATGFRPGASQTLSQAVLQANPEIPPVYQSDTVLSTEVGIKGRLLHRLQYDLSLYHENWKDIQLSAAVAGEEAVFNAGQARIDGVEGQVDYSDPLGFDLGGTFAYNNARLTEIIPALLAPASAVNYLRSGDRLPGSPKVTVAAYAEYHWHITPDLKATVGATGRYQGDMMSDYPGDPLNVNYDIPGYGTLDLRAALEWSRYTAQFSMTNVTDVNGITGSSLAPLVPGTTLANAYLIRPRTFRITLSAEF